MKVDILTFLSKRGALLEPDAMDYLLERENPVTYLDTLWDCIDHDSAILSMRDILRAEEVSRKALAKAQVVALGPEDHPPEFQLLRSVECARCEGRASDFARYFENRFQKLKLLLRKKHELVGSTPISKVRKSTGEVKFVGIVNSVSTTKNGHRIIELEDEKDRVKAFISSGSELIGDPIIQDEVLGVVGKRSKELVIVGELVRPGHSMNKSFVTAKSPVLAAFISDLHVGSKNFLYEQWKEFSKWFTSEPSLRYIVMAGDLIDGVGIYPKQEDDLQIEDVCAQYEELARLLKDVPRHVKVVFMPGNHDAVRPAEPQPPLSQDIREMFGSNVESLGNPSLFQLDGVTVLAYHGRSIDDFVVQMNGASYGRPIDIMKAMLQKRHLVPIYGGKTPIAPEREDWLVMDTVPDIFVTGHVHAFGLESYRGIRLINSSTWQAQTDFQRMHNQVPEPCKVSVVNLGTGECHVRDFLA